MSQPSSRHEYTAECADEDFGDVDDAAAAAVAKKAVLHVAVSVPIVTGSSLFGRLC